MKRKKCVLIILIILFLISLIFPIKSNTMKQSFNSAITAIELDDQEYVFDIIPDADNFSAFEYRFCTFDTVGHKGTIHYKLVDQVGNVIFENSEKISNIKTNEYRLEFFEKQKNSKGKKYKFIVSYDEYYKNELFGIWVSSQGTDTNYLENDNTYGLEAYIKSDVPNIMLSWFMIIAIAIYVLYMILEKDKNYEKKN